MPMATVRRARMARHIRPSADKISTMRLPRARVLVTRLEAVSHFNASSGTMEFAPSRPRQRITTGFDRTWCGLTIHASEPAPRGAYSATGALRLFGHRTKKRLTVLRTALATTLLLIATIGCARDLAIVGASVYGSPDAARLAEATIVVGDGRIERVGPVRDVRIPDGMPMIDGRGTTVVAGFWNSHIHLLRPDVLDAASQPAATL